jgi:hypothetical protein
MKCGKKHLSNFDTFHVQMKHDTPPFPKYCLLVSANILETNEYTVKHVPSTPQFQLKLSLHPSRPLSPFASLCYKIFPKRENIVTDITPSVERILNTELLQ